MVWCDRCRLLLTLKSVSMCEGERAMKHGAIETELECIYVHEMNRGGGGLRRTWIESWGTKQRICWVFMSNLEYIKPKRERGKKVLELHRNTVVVFLLLSFNMLLYTEEIIICHWWMRLDTVLSPLHQSTPTVWWLVRLGASVNGDKIRYPFTSSQPLQCNSFFLLYIEMLKIHLCG